MRFPSPKRARKPKPRPAKRISCLKADGRENADTTKDKGQNGFFFPLHFSKKAHQPDAYESKQIIENKGGGRKDIGRFDKVQKPVDKPDGKTVPSTIDVGKNQDGHKGRQRNRAAVLHGLEFNQGKHERAGYANTCKRNTFGIVLFAFLFTEKPDERNEDKQSDDCTDGDPLDDVGGFCTDFKKGIKKHKNTPFPSFA